MTTTKASRTWQDNATEFGVLTKQGKDVRLALLAACSVEKGSKEGVTIVTPSGKVTGRAFAEKAGSTAPRVLRHLAAWDEFAKAVGYPLAKELAPADALTLEVSEGDAVYWADHVSLNSKGGDESAKVRDVKNNTAAVAEAMKDPEFREKLGKRVDTDHAIDLAMQASETPTKEVHTPVDDMVRDPFMVIRHRIVDLGKASERLAADVAVMLLDDDARDDCAKAVDTLRTEIGALIEVLNTIYGDPIDEITAYLEVNS